MFHKKEWKKTNQTKFKTKKTIKRKGTKLYVKWKDYDNSFNSCIDKKISLYKMSYFPEPHTYSRNKIKAELDLSNYAIKQDSKTEQVSIHRHLLNRLI